MRTEYDANREMATPWAFAEQVAQNKKVRAKVARIRAAKAAERNANKKWWQIW